MIRPEPEPMLAMALLRLLQLPPVVASLNRMVEPWHTTAVGKVMAAGSGLTVKSNVLKQPAGNV